MKKRFFSLTLALLLFISILPPSVFASDLSYDAIPGYWEGMYSSSSVYELSSTLKKCTQFDVYFEVLKYTGNPFRTWTVHARDMSGNWTKVGSFNADKYNNGQYYRIKLNSPLDITALQVRLDGAHNVSYDCGFYNASYQSSSSNSSGKKSTTTSSDNGGAIYGTFEGKRNGWSIFECDPILKKCLGFDFHLDITEATGNPYRTWILSVRDSVGDWIKIGTFVLHKEYADVGEDFTVTFDKPINVSAIHLQLDGGYSSTTYWVEFSNARY